MLENKTVRTEMSDKGKASTDSWEILQSVTKSSGYLWINSLEWNSAYQSFFFVVQHIIQTHSQRDRETDN